MCFNTGPMDRRPAQHLYTLLSALEPSVAEPALQPLERLVARPEAGGPLIVALVGASGVGKSEIMNALAGVVVVMAGPLRPTTTEITIWGDVDAAYLSGTRIADREPLDGLALVDTPAAEHYPETVATVLDLVDAVVFVASPERYADAMTATSLATIRERGIPMRVVLSTGAHGQASPDGFAEHVTVKMGMPVDVSVGEDVSLLRLLLDEMVRDRADLIGQRDRAAREFCAMRTREVAGVLEERIARSLIVVGRADEALARARVDRRELAAMADEEWEVAAPAIAAMISETTDRAIGELSEAVAADEISSRTVTEAAASLPPIDRGPIDDWHRATTESAVASITRRWLHPMRSRAVREEMWRLSIDFDRRPSTRVRKALSGRLPDLRLDRNAALTAALRDAGSAKIEAFRTGLNPSGRVSTGDLRVAADAVATGGLLPGEVADGVA